MNITTYRENLNLGLKHQNTSWYVVSMEWETKKYGHPKTSRMSIRKFWANQMLLEEDSEKGSKITDISIPRDIK